MVTVKINISPVVQLLQKKLDKLKDREYLLRPVAFDVIDLMTQRIHIKGIASDGAPIGKYSKGYMRLRLKFNRGKAEEPVIISLTRQLENDWSVIGTEKGYAIGFKNPYNLKKARWVELIKRERENTIFNLTTQEQEFALAKINRLVTEALEL